MNRSMLIQNRQVVSDVSVVSVDSELTSIITLALLRGTLVACRPSEFMTGWYVAIGSRAFFIVHSRNSALHKAQTELRAWLRRTFECV